MQSKPTSAIAVARGRIRPVSLQCGHPLIAFAIACLAVSFTARATDLGSAVSGNNTADGSGVLVSLTSGVNNAGLGFQALNDNATGSANTAVGFEALFRNVSGNNNTAIGIDALLSNTASNNTASGCQALLKNTSGFDNTSRFSGADV